MIVKTSELIGDALDWAVTHALFPQASLEFFRYRHALGHLHYSETWAQSGPLLEEEEIAILRLDDDYGKDERGYCNNVRLPRWGAVKGQCCSFNLSDLDNRPAYWYEETEVTLGPTPLVAAMRCFVAARLGDTVEVPDNLQEG